jgi:hypothetical protein
MPFSSKVKQEALVKSRRRCCICHVFAGLYSAVHHILHESDKGPNTIDNAIVLCQRCHGEGGHYNPRHPIGNKYSRDELRKHRDLWWDACERTAGFSFPEDPISVSPPKIELLTPHRQTCGEFAVSNRTNDPYWQVWLSLTFQPSSIDIANLDIRITERSPQGARTKRVGDLSVEGLHIITHDEEGRKLRFFMIDRLRPAQYVYFIARLPLNSIPGGLVELCVDLWSVDNTPLMLGFKYGKPLLDLKFPVPLHGEGHIWFQGSYPIQDS